MRSVGVFTQADLVLTDEITLNFGARYDREKKDAQISGLFRNQCVLGGGCASYDLDDSQTWNAFTPKIGIQLSPTESTMMYAFWTKAFRSGGYNMRHTAILIPNEAFDQEEMDSVEVGLKTDFADGRVRLNAAVFHNQFDDMQREINLTDPVTGVVQLIRNTADTTITGADAEIGWAITESLFLQASVGYVAGAYDQVQFDLTGDDVIDAADRALEIPRLAPWSYGAQFTYQRPWSQGTFTVQGSGYHRDASAYTDNNAGWLRPSDMFSANVSLGFMDDRLTVSAFGKNLKDEVTIGGDTQLPPNFPGGPAFPVPSLAGPKATFSPLNKGRVYGLEVQYRMD